MKSIMIGFILFVSCSSFAQDPASIVKIYSKTSAASALEDATSCIGEVAPRLVAI